METLKMNTWNDDRLDELNQRVSEGFTRVDREMDRRFDEAAAEMDRRFGQAAEEMDRRFGQADAEMNRRFNEADARFDRFEIAVGSRFDEVAMELRRINERFDRLLSTLVVASVGVVAALLANGVFG
jgi:hypothetical protein